MRSALLLAPIVCAFGLVACGGGDDSTAGTAPVDDENTLSFTTGEFEVPAGDSFTCFYTNHFTDRELSVYDADGIQGPGGHHIVAYWTEQTRDPGYHPCVDSEMVNWHQIAGGSGQGNKAGEGSITGLPEGLAIKVPAGKQLVMQAHYINTTGKPETVNDTVKLRLLDPAKVKSYVNYFVTLDEKFKIPPASKLSRVTTCTTTRDFDMVLVLGHMHELGKHYKLETIDDAGKSLDVIRDDEWHAEYSSHPPVTRYSMAEPLHLPKGTTLRQTCEWDNTTAEPVLFPREMCLAFSYYFPGVEDLICDMQPEVPEQ